MAQPDKVSVDRHGEREQNIAMRLNPLTQVGVRHVAIPESILKFKGHLSLIASDYERGRRL